MESQNREVLFSRVYLWITNAKFTMGMLYCFFVFAYLLFGIIATNPAVTLDFFTALEMLFASFFIGLLRQIILPNGNITKVRGVLWIVSGFVILISFSLIFGWFKPFPSWCLFLFAVCFLLATLAMVFTYYLELMRETRRLNQLLEQFKKRQPS